MLALRLYRVQALLSAPTWFHFGHYMHMLQTFHLYLDHLFHVSLKYFTLTALFTVVIQ